MHRVSVDDVSLTVQEHRPPEGGTASASGLVFLPALGVPLAYYRPLLQHWAARGRRVFAVELRGMPQSPVPDLRRARFGYADLVRTDLPGVVRLVADAGLRDIVLAGHSLGGQLALLASASRRVSPAAIVTLATGTSSPGHLPPAQRLMRRAAVGVVRAVSATVGHWPGHRLGFAGRQPSSVMRDWAHEARHGRYRLAGDPTDYEAALAALHTPVLMIGLEGDRMVPPAAVAQLARRVGGPAQQLTLPARDAGRPTGFAHISWVRRTPEPVVHAVEGWLAARGL